MNPRPSPPPGASPAVDDSACQGDRPRTAPFLDFVLRNAQVRANVCTRPTWTGQYQLARRTVPDYNLIYAQRGRVVWTVGDQPIPLAPGDLAVIPPNVPHYAASTSRTGRLCSIHVEASLPGGQDVFALLVPAMVRHVARGSRLDGYLRGAATEWDREDEHLALLMMPAWARLLVLELLCYDTELGILHQNPVDEMVTTVLAELGERLHAQTTLADLAEHAGFSPQHLNRVFRKVLGVTPLQYLTRMRLERAAAMLTEGDRTVTEVARIFGYDDAYYFSRLFKHHFGRSPAHYREFI